MSVRDWIVENVETISLSGVSAVLAGAGAYARHEWKKAVERVKEALHVVDVAAQDAAAAAADVAQERIDALLEETRGALGASAARMDAMFEKVNQRLSSHIESRLH